MQKFLLTCFLALLCLVGSPTSASSKVADSPPEVPLHRSGSVVSPHSGDTHREGAILPDSFHQIDKGVEISSPPLHRSGLSTVDGGPNLPSPVLSTFPTGVGKYEASVFGLPASSIGHPATHRSPIIGHPTTLPTPQLSLELSGNEESKLAQHSRGLSTVDCGPENETATSLFGAPRSDDSRHPTPDTGHPTPGTSLVDNSTSQGQEEGNTPAQVGEPAVSDSLTIGDQIPSGIEFNSILNHDGDPIRLDDYQGKYLILQFWAPTCTASIASLKQTKQLNEKFGSKIEILPLTVFPEASILQTMENIPALKEYDIPLVVGAEQLVQYFPHSVIPHFIVISPNGEILAITGLEDMTEKNLELLTTKDEIAFRHKKDTQSALDIDAKLISGSPQISNKNIWFQSAFTGYIPEVSGSLIQSHELMSHIRIVNMSLTYHYRLAYSERSLTDYFGRNRIEIVGFDPDEFTTGKAGLDHIAWMAEGNHVFGYELIAPLHLNPYELMREDLKRYLPHIEAKVENQTRKVLALVQQEGKSYPKSTAPDQGYKSGNMGVQMTQYPLDGFVYHLNAMFLRTNPIPVINLTGIDYPIDLTVNAKLSDVESLREGLSINGFDLIEREEEIPVLVIRKIAQSKFVGL